MAAPALRRFSRWLAFVLSFAACWLFGRAAFATTIPGGNIINQTWTPAGNPYLIQGDVTVPAGHQHLVVRHHPRGLWVGVVLSVLALLTSIGLPIALRRPARLGRGGEAR